MWETASGSREGNKSLRRVLIAAIEGGDGVNKLLRRCYRAGNVSDCCVGRAISLRRVRNAANEGAITALSVCEGLIVPCVETILSCVACDGGSTRFTQGTVAFDDRGFLLCRTLRGDVDPAAWPPLALPAPPGVPAANHYRFVRDMTMAVLEDREPHVTGEEAKKSIDVIDAM